MFLREAKCSGQLLMAYSHPKTTFLPMLLHQAKYLRLLPARHLLASSTPAADDEDDDEEDEAGDDEEEEEEKAGGGGW